jgi:hypothetical protein
MSGSCCSAVLVLMYSTNALLSSSDALAAEFNPGFAWPTGNTRTFSCSISCVGGIKASGFAETFAGIDFAGALRGVGGVGLGPVAADRGGFFNIPTPPLLATGGGGIVGTSLLDRKGVIGRGGGGRDLRSTVGGGVVEMGGGRLNGLNCEQAVLVVLGGYCCTCCP